MSANILIVSGHSDSGRNIWQTLWQKANPEFVRVQQENWDTLIVVTGDSNWKGCKHIRQGYRPGCHSLGCLLVANWHRKLPCSSKLLCWWRRLIRRMTNFPNGTKGFAPF
jgi:predicted alpha/beta hydrolase family esterase